jgi:transposase-like protein
LKLKELGKYPQTIITDGLAGYVSSIPKVFGKAKHLLCLFHHQQGVTRWVKKHLGSLKDEESEQVKKRMKKVTQTRDSRTAKRRLKRLEKEDAQNGWGIGSWITRCWENLKHLIPSLRANGYPKTTNTIERFFRSFQRFYKTRCGFHSVQSAKRELILFMVMYLFTQQAQSGKAPIETIVPEANHMPLYKLLNDPFGCGIATICQSDDKHLEEMAAQSLKMAA